AVAGSDYLEASGTLTFQPGETSQAIVVDVLGDAQGEVTETFAVELSAPVNAGLRYAGGTGTIVSDDAIFLLQERALVESDVNPYMRDRQSHNVLAVTVAEPILRQVSVGLATADGSAVAGVDYKATSTTLTFAPGEVKKYLLLNLVPDNPAESNENFFIEFTNLVHGTTPNDRVEMTIEDDDYACPATPNLLTNGSANATDWAVGAIPGWIDVGGNGWRIAGGGVDYPATLFTFQAPAWVEGELRQDVDVSGFAAGIDRGEQFFRFEGFLFEDAIGNRGRIVVEFLDLSQQQILTWFDSTEQVPAGYWKQKWGRLAKIVQAPMGTRWIRVRLLSVDMAGQPGYLGYTHFDGFIVQALDMPFLSIGDATVTEGDAGTVAAPFDVNLSCVRDHGVSVHYFT
ncbi:MAG: hypothetical protein GY856_24115, partial [bacterium]|nr:hypothetical protein [bacterium]